VMRIIDSLCQTGNPGPGKPDIKRRAALCKHIQFTPGANATEQPYKCL